jgi:hypothetical protein
MLRGVDVLHRLLFGIERLDAIGLVAPAALLRHAIRVNDQYQIVFRFHSTVGHPRSVSLSGLCVDLLAVATQALDDGLRIRLTDGTACIRCPTRQIKL